MTQSTINRAGSAELYAALAAEAARASATWRTASRTDLVRMGSSIRRLRDAMRAAEVAEAQR
jgi:hypothetical protein